MIVTVSFFHLLMGTVYTSYGVLTAIDLKRGWRTFGFSHFGVAWITVAFTCGPHHLDHGLHVALGSGARGLDAAAVIFGVPAGLTWFLLRLEAFNGGRGDRIITGTPRWLRVAPWLVGAVLGVLAVWMASELRGELHFSVLLVPNVLLAFLYGQIGYYLVRTQLANHRLSGEWSVSGLSLFVVFPTCAAMHLAHIVYATTGAYTIDQHGTIIDWLSVPATLYFLWVVRSLYLGAIQDWNGRPRLASGVGVASSAGAR